MAFEKGKALIEQANALETRHQMIEMEMEETGGVEYTESEADEAYAAYWKAIDCLADYLKNTVTGIDKKTAWAMAKDRRNEMLTLFSRAK